jgi:hypothetical protein
MVQLLVLILAILKYKVLNLAIKQKDIIIMPIKKGINNEKINKLSFCRSSCNYTS